MKNINEGYIYKSPDFSVAIKYSDKANKEGLIKFIPKGGKPFEISSESLVSLLANHVNANQLKPAIVHNDMIRMIQVQRTISFTPNKDIKAGETVYIPYKHMHPIEFAIAEEALGVAKIPTEVKFVNMPQYREANKRVTAQVQKFADEQYQAFIKKLQDNQGTG